MTFIFETLLFTFKFFALVFKLSSRRTLYETFKLSNLHFELSLDLISFKRLQSQFIDAKNATRLSV